ncbi:MAG: hypothetical protein PCFJNLEI_03888 [Verrucomicrobiae bacterium]|nr:hypothetical protein [Verrucomicrobiae bacterium]
MQTPARCLKVLVLAVLLLPFAADAAKAKSYQVTGKVVELSDTTIIVQKDDEKWEITRDANSKVTGDLKVGAKVTIQYKMTATTVEVKEDKKAK